MSQLHLRRLAFAIMFGGLAALLVGPSLFAQAPAGGKGKGTKAMAAVELNLPEGLRHVPPDAVAFLHIRVGDSLQGPQSQALLKQLRPDGDHGKFVEQVEKRLGVRLADVDSITLFVLDLSATPFALPQGPAKGASQPAKGFGTKKAAPGLTASDIDEPASSPATEADDMPSFMVALTYNKPIDRKAVLRALAGSGNPPFWPSVSGLFLSDHCVLFGNSAELVNYTTRSRSPFGPTGVTDSPWATTLSRARGALYTALAAGTEPHFIVGGAQVPTTATARIRLRQLTKLSNLGPLGAILPLLQTSAGLTVDVRDAVEMTVRFYDSDRLTLGAVESLRTLAEMTLDGDVGKSKLEGTLALTAPMHNALRKGLAKATIESTARNIVEARVRLELDPDAFARLLVQTVERLR
jgi:hypothetical protein